MTGHATSEVQLENNHFRVTKWTIPPRTHIPMHVHEYEYVVIPLVTDTMHVVQADGTVLESHLVTGQSYSRPAGSEHQVENRSAHNTISFVEIEKMLPNRS